MTERFVSEYNDFEGYSASDLLERTEDLLAVLGMDRNVPTNALR